MAKIRARGYLIAGVDQSTYHFGYLDPLNGQLEGFDIDMVRAVATAIFGNPDGRSSTRPSPTRSGYRTSATGPLTSWRTR